MKPLPLFLLLFAAIISSQIGAQGSNKKIRVENANSLEYNEQFSEAQVLKGNVVLSHQGAFLYCDSAYLFDKENRLEAFSRVRIESDTVKITGNRLTYNANEKQALITGDVLLTDPGTILTTNELYYNTSTGVANYLTGGKIVSNRNKNELTSELGSYFSKEKTFYFKRKVLLVNEKYTMFGDTLQYNTVNETAYFFGPTTIKSKENTIYCENGYYNTRSDIAEFGKNAWLKGKTQKIKGQSLYYDRKLAFGKALRKVEVIDSVQQIKVTGNYALYFEQNERVTIADSALFHQFFEKDTLYLHADTLKAFTTSNTGFRTLKAYARCQFLKKDMQGKCDTLIYSYADSVMRMFGKPIIWSEDNQLTGNYTTIHLKNSKIDHLILHENGVIASKEDTVRFNQIKGKVITGFFESNELRKIDVKGNGQSVYYSKDNKNDYIGINKAICSDMVILLDSSKVEEILFLTQPEAVFYPVNELSYKEWMLKDFKWMGAIRPRSVKQLFVWRNTNSDTE